MEHRVYACHGTACVCVADPTGKQSGEIESIVIMIAVLLIVLITALINWSKDLQFRGLQQQLDKQLKCLVVRNGNISQVPSGDVVVGDICIIKYGTIYSKYVKRKLPPLRRTCCLTSPLHCFVKFCLSPVIVIIVFIVLLPLKKVV